MILFEIILNFIEALMCSVFLAHYFHLEDKRLYVYITTTIQFVLLMFVTFINNSILWLTGMIVLVMVASLIEWTREIKIDYFYLIILYRTLLSCINGFCWFVCQAIPLSNTDVVLIQSVMNCLIQIIITLWLMKMDINLMINVDISEIKKIVLSDGFIFFVTSLLCALVMITKYTPYVLFIVLFLMLVYHYRMKNMVKLNEERIDYAKALELARFNEQKLLMMNQIKNDIAATDHRMFYILLQMEKYLEDKQYDKMQEMLVKYRELMTKYKVITDTNNVVFDCLYSLKINDMILKGQNVENVILISQNESYNDINFINLINSFLDYFEDCKALRIAMIEVDGFFVLRVIYREGKINEELLIKFLDDHLTSQDKYNMYNHEVKGIRVSIALDTKEV